MDRQGTRRNGAVPRDSQTTPVLVVAVRTGMCAIPIEYVGETMRPLPIEPLSGPHHFVRGVSMIRGAPVPVVDLDALLDAGANGNGFRRFVTVRVGERRVALAVDRVVGVREIDPTQLGELPPLLRHIDPNLVEAIGTSDAQLLLVLCAARLIPDGDQASFATALAEP